MAEFSHRSLHGAKSGRRRLFAATAAIAVLITIDGLSGGSVRSAMRTFAAGIWKGSERARAGIVESGYFRSHRSLAQENAALRAELAQYEEKAAGYDVLTTENAQLRSALHLPQMRTGLTAPVVSSFKSSPYGTFMIGAGKGDPVKNGDFVLTDGGFVVGIVSDVQAHTAMVRGVFSAGEGTDVLIGDTAATISGDGGGNAHAIVPRDAKISEGDPVRAPLYGGRAIGVVGHVESSATGAEQTVYVRIPVNLSALRYVYIISAHE